MDVTLTPAQEDLLREAGSNDGRLYAGGVIDAPTRKALDSLVRNGMLSVGKGRYGGDRRDVTAHGWRWLDGHPAELPAIEHADLVKLHTELTEAEATGCSSNDYSQIVDDFFTEHGWPSPIYGGQR
jgi:hypothetical protein